MLINVAREGLFGAQQGRIKSPLSPDWAAEGGPQAPWIIMVRSKTMQRSQRNKAQEEQRVKRGTKGVVVMSSLVKGEDEGEGEREGEGENGQAMEMDMEMEVTIFRISLCLNSAPRIG